MSSASPRLRFAMITTFYPPYHFGGDGIFVRRLAHALAAGGHEVHIIHDVNAFKLLGGDDSREPLPEPDGVTVHPLEGRMGFLSCLATQQLGRPLVTGRKIRRILQEPFDVIHFHNISLIGGPGILSYGDGLKLYTMHEHWLVCPSHILWRHNREICDGRECLRCVLAHRRPPQLWRMTSLLERQCRHVDAFLALSQSCADNHRRFGFKFPMTVLPSFLPDERSSIRDGSPKNPGEHRYFLFVGRLEIIKGLQDVIPMFDGTIPAELWIAGSGDYEPELRKLAQGKPAVKFLGHQGPEELHELYQNAIAVVAPSLCYEVFPMVVLEAFREGTPVVARKLGPFPEIIEQSQGGLLFENQNELKGALLSVADDPGYRRQLGAAAANAFDARWSEKAVLTQYYDLIEQLATDRKIDRISQKFAGAGREG